MVERLTAGRAKDRLVAVLADAVPGVAQTRRAEDVEVPPDGIDAWQRSAQVERPVQQGTTSQAIVDCFPSAISGRSKPDFA